MTFGQVCFQRATADFDEDDLSAPCALPGWNRRHLIGHVAGNADALTNLVTWASTGVETHMYASPADRADGIARAAHMTGEELRAWLANATARLDEGLAGLTSAQWNRVIRTVQGRALPATEIPWLRAREVMVHSVDLASGVEFSSFPEDFLDALVVDITTFRGGVTLPDGPVHEIAAWLAGRRYNLDDAPVLEPWL
jgi:maleylpyruvate isomerase